MNRWTGLGLAALLTVAVTAGCGAKQEAASGTEVVAHSADGAKNEAGSANADGAANTGGSKDNQQPASSQTRTLDYLGKSYTVPAKVDRIVITGAVEAMEDALVLGVKPVGAMTVGGKFPDMFKDITGEATAIGEKTQPNLETILKLKPDVILGSSKFPPATVEQLEKLGPVFPVSHISTNWEANLRLLAELTGKQEQAEQVLQKYKEDVKAAKAKLGDKLKDKKVVAIRVRTGNIMMYPQDVFFNPSLYEDLGLSVPAEVAAAKAQETVSLEKFSEMNPDFIFLQFSEDENTAQPKALEDLQNNPIWKSINAVKNGRVFVNVVDPLAQGGTSWSKIQFLQAAVEKLNQ